MRVVIDSHSWAIIHSVRVFVYLLEESMRNKLRNLDTFEKINYVWIDKVGTNGYNKRMLICCLAICC